MAYAAAKFVRSLTAAIQGQTGIVEDTYVEVDGMEVPYFGVPVELGPRGIAKILPLPSMSAKEQERLKIAMPILKQNIETGLNFAKSN